MKTKTKEVRNMSQVEMTKEVDKKIKVLKKELADLKRYKKTLKKDCGCVEKEVKSWLRGI